MAKLQAQILLREFNYNGVRIPDPAPQMSVEQVRDLLVPSYPELATATVPLSCMNELFSTTRTRSRNRRMKWQ
jgi:PRTRC genetic system protein C